MIFSETLQDRLRHAFAPTPHGIVGLTEQLLEACIGGDMTFERVRDQCVCRWTSSGVTQEVLSPLPPAAFRTILARIAVLCNEQNPNSVTPYGGEGLLTVKVHPPTVVQVNFVNTPDKQQLELKSSVAENLDAVDNERVIEKASNAELRPPTGSAPSDKVFAK
jgi:hypothetical protein